MLKRLKKIKLPLKNINGKNWVVKDSSTPEEIIEVDVVGYDDNYQEYLVLIPESVAGYSISRFHILHYEVPEKFLGKRFNTYHVTGRNSSRSD